MVGFRQTNTDNWQELQTGVGRQIVAGFVTRTEHTQHRASRQLRFTGAIAMPPFECGSNP